MSKINKQFSKSFGILQSDLELINKQLKSLKYKEIEQVIVIDNLRKENQKLKTVISDLTTKNNALSAEIESIRKISCIVFDDQSNTMDSQNEKCDTKDETESDWVFY